MPAFSANLSMMFTEHAFLDRFAAARDAGFDAVEFLFPYDHSAEAVARARSAAGVALALFNLPPGDWAAGDRGMAAIPGREAEFAASLQRALDYGEVLGTRRLHAMAGVTEVTAENRSCYVANIREAADRCAAAGVELTIEPINPHDMPGYFLSTTAQALALMDEIDHAALRLQFDIYHHQITRGDVIRTLGTCLERIGHIQIAGVPGRNEPDTGELNYRDIFRFLDTAGYGGWVGCEYRPRTDTVAGLGWLRDLRRAG